MENAARDNKKTRIMPQPIHVVAITVNILMMPQTSSSVDADDDEDEDEEETGSEEEEEDGRMRTMIDKARGGRGNKEESGDESQDLWARVQRECRGRGSDSIYKIKRSLQP
ncbi:hypothetical protein RHGRI_016175 [Rhododendron griersonianum]|uniref:Uncharacterized protein n=1 Tax=Rhododendron griersonianum TaxID=479676 RepID=A0AAV6JSI2_9ERIC|nr:hypothetical protein RHGRI_016175 [Rhododendron griersonianum]